MWIKTKNNELLNTDQMRMICYDADSDRTYCYGSDHFCCMISEGDYIPTLINALRRGDNYVGVDL